MPEIECLGCGGVTKFALVKTDQNTPTITLRGLVSCPGGRIETISQRRMLGAMAQREILVDKVRDHNPKGIWEWPVTIRSSGKEGVIEETANALDSAQSQLLVAGKVPDGLRQDIQEAEKCHHSFSYKAAVVMCRRALQIALEDKLKPSGTSLTLGPLLKEERKANPHLFTESEYAFATRIKELGDEGAHQIVTIEPKTVEVAIHDTVRLLNTLYQ